MNSRSQKTALALLACFVAVVLIAWLAKGPRSEWILPKELNEISGICFLNGDTVACVQDEKASIFLYDLKTQEIVDEIPFAGKGDCEGIALNGDIAYVVTGNGLLYKIDHFRKSPVTIVVSLNLAENEESEAICFDKKNKALVLAFKNHKKVEVEPKLRLLDFTADTVRYLRSIPVNLRGMLLQKKDRKNAKRSWEPADIAIDPQSGSFLIVDAINGHLIQLSAAGEFEKMDLIDAKKVRHPEGIAFSSKDELFLCNDANHEGKGKIVKWKR